MSNRLSFNAFCLSALLALPVAAAPLAARAANVVDNLAGCFQVSYRFVEDGTHDTDIHGDIYEWIKASHNSDGSSYFQHYGIENNQAHVHWGETWTQTADGSWTQEVVDPDGNPRYHCTGKFVFNQWTCNILNTPKPNRDADRTDYVTLDRGVTLQITPKGWVMSQNNIKRDKAGNAVSNEVGWDEYKRVDDKMCAAAQ